MNFKLKAAAAAVAFALSGAAQAAPIGQQGLFFTAWNGSIDAPSSIVINLGLSTPDFRADPLAPRALGGDGLDALNAWLGGLGDTASSVVWSVIGRSNGDGASSPPSPLYGGLATSTNIETQFPSWGLFGGLDQFPLNVQNFLDTVNPSLASGNAFAAANRFQEFFVNKDGGPDIESRGGINQSLAFYAFFGDQDGNEFFEGDFSKFNGTWTLNFAPGTGASLSYAPVPLPGAVWLLGSALAGFAATQRRRA
ncbi:MAG: VPLPA-CTERM sorting domain-containing protein [Gammaproteobacteria bacterium]